MHSDKISHFSVMASEVLEYMNIFPGGVYLDATFGHGGHSRLMLEKGAKKVFALDRDRHAIETYGPTAQEQDRLEVVHGAFSLVDELLPKMQFDAILMDLGVSTLQLLDSKRGFSFSNSGPLDMRMDTTQGMDLQQLLATVEEPELAQFFYEKAKISNPKKMAWKVKKAHSEGKLATTGDLANLFPKKPWDKTHPATPVFLGLRMLLNQELEEIELAVPKMLSLLKDGGRLVILTFHSSEDALIKGLFKHYSGVCTCENLPCFCKPLNVTSLVTRKAIKPSEAELSVNPRSRSALLRCVEKKPAAQ